MTRLQPVPPDPTGDGLDAIERPARRRLTSRDTSRLLEAATARDDRLWGEIESCLVLLEGRYTLRVRRLRRDLHWLRKQANSRGYDWGLK